MKNNYIYKLGGNPNQNNTMNDLEHKGFMSLFEYLGKPAGNKLGKEVFTVAKKLNTVRAYKDIETKKYKGKIVVYPKSFLDIYFTIKPI